MTSSPDLDILVRKWDQMCPGTSARNSCLILVFFLIRNLFMCIVKKSWLNFWDILDGLSFDFNKIKYYESCLRCNQLMHEVDSFDCMKKIEGTLKFSIETDFKTSNVNFL